MGEKFHYIMGSLHSICLSVLIYKEWRRKKQFKRISRIAEGFINFNGGKNEKVNQAFFSLN